MKNGLLIGRPDATAAGELADMVAAKLVRSAPAHKSEVLPASARR
jgi:hypothetical protein